MRSRREAPGPNGCARRSQGWHGPSDLDESIHRIARRFGLKLCRNQGTARCDIEATNTSSVFAIQIMREARKSASSSIR